MIERRRVGLVFLGRWVFLLLLFPFGLGASPVKSDEEIVFFPVNAWQTEQGLWQAEVHGWIFEPETGSLWRNAFLAGLDEALGDEGETEDEAERNPWLYQRLRYFLADNERNKRVRIRLGNEVHELPASGANGHFRDVVQISFDPAEAAEAGWLGLEAVLSESDQRSFGGRVHLIAPEGWSVISDIDDTVKISQVRDKASLLRNTFLRPFQAIPGMPGLFRKWAAAGADFHYVSSSPWQLYPPLADFFEQAGLPAGSVHLKTVRFMDQSLFALFEDPMQYKIGQIETILARYPRRCFILVGDSGERDPEIYAEMGRRYPAQVRRILIRAVAEDVGDLARWRAAFRGLPEGFATVFKHPAEDLGETFLPPERCDR